MQAAEIQDGMALHKNRDRWPLAVANKVLMQYYEATADNRALDVLKKYFRYLHDTPPDWPDKDWRGVRAMENAVTGYWLYRADRMNHGYLRQLNRYKKTVPTGQPTMKNFHGIQQLLQIKGYRLTGRQKV